MKGVFWKSEADGLSLLNLAIDSMKEPTVEVRHASVAKELDPCVGGDLIASVERVSGTLVGGNRKSRYE